MNLFKRIALTSLVFRMKNAKVPLAKPSDQISKDEMLLLWCFMPRFRNDQLVLHRVLAMGTFQEGNCAAEESMPDSNEDCHPISL